MKISELIDKVETFYKLAQIEIDDETKKQWWYADPQYAKIPWWKVGISDGDIKCAKCNQDIIKGEAFYEDHKNKICKRCYKVIKNERNTKYDFGRSANLENIVEEAMIVGIKFTQQKIEENKKEELVNLAYKLQMALNISVMDFMKAYAEEAQKYGMVMEQYIGKYNLELGFYRAMVETINKKINELDFTDSGIKAKVRYLYRNVNSPKMLTMREHPYKGQTEEEIHKKIKEIDKNLEKRRKEYEELKNK